MAEFKELNKDFAYELMSVPTCSSMEHRMITYIMLFAEKNGIDYQFDNYGNLYLTKGKLNEGEYYPCLTAHVDTVQTKQKPYINSGESLTIQTRTNKDNKTEIYCDGFGIGGDDKCGVLIALSVIQKVDKMKATFFLEEEVGCKGSNNLDDSFFDNVGYVIGFDSPDFNRSAWSVSGTQLFDKDFYLNHMKDICDKHGRTKFHSEPFTDLVQIRKTAPIQAMNFGSGYYHMHTDSEYVVLEEVDDCIQLALDLIHHLEYKRYYLRAGKSSYSSYGYSSYYSGSNYVLNPKTKVYERKINVDDSNVDNKKEKEDLEFLRSLGDNSYGNSSNHFVGGISRYARNIYDDEYYNDYEEYYDEDYYNSGIYSNRNYNKKSSKNTKIDDDSIMTDEKVLLYVIEKYEERLKQIQDDIEDKCKELKLDYDKDFKQIFENIVLF